MEWFSRKKKLSEKEKLVEQIKLILSKIYQKILLINRLTSDPSGSLERKSMDVYSNILQDDVYILELWAGDETLEKNEIKHLEELLKREDNPVIKRC